MDAALDFAVLTPLYPGGGGRGFWNVVMIMDV